MVQSNYNLKFIVNDLFVDAFLSILLSFILLDVFVWLCAYL